MYRSLGAAMSYLAAVGKKMVESFTVLGEMVLEMKNMGGAESKWKQLSHYQV